MTDQTEGLEPETDDAPPPAVEVATDVNNVKQVQDRKRRQKVEDERADRVLVELMKLKDGRLLIWRWLSSCRLFQSSYAGADHHTMAFWEGHRNVGLPLLAKLHRLCSEDYATMQEENGK